MSIELAPAEHPLVTVAREARRHNVGGLEIRHRWSRDGINVRLWCDNRGAAYAIRDVAWRVGFDVPLCDHHVHNGEHKGWQILIVVHATDMAALSRAMVEAGTVLARQLPAATP